MGWGGVRDMPRRPAAPLHPQVVGQGSTPLHAASRKGPGRPLGEARCELHSWEQSISSRSRGALLCSRVSHLFVSVPAPPKTPRATSQLLRENKSREPLGVAPQTQPLPFPARMHPPRCPPKLSKQPQAAFTRGVLGVHPLPKIRGVPAGRSILYFGGTLRRLGQRLGDPLQSPTYLSGSLRRPARFRVRQSRPLAGAEPPFGPPDGASARPPVPLESAGS